MQIFKYISIVALLYGSTSCEKDFPITLPDVDNTLVVEGTVNQWSPDLNYVILSRVVKYFDPGLNIQPVSNAQVFITEGVKSGSDTIWETPVQFKESFVKVLKAKVPGVYVADGFKAFVGKIYRLQVTTPTENVVGYSELLSAPLLDSLTYKEVFDVDGKSIGYNGVAHHNDPPERGNNYRIIYRINNDSIPSLWGVPDNQDFTFSDELINGIYRDRQLRVKLEKSDTLHYYMASLDRPLYNFWQSFSSAQGNGGPYATPLKLQSNIKGATGSFSAYGIAYKYVIIPK